MRWGLLALSLCACHAAVREDCGTERAELSEYRQSTEACESGDLRACLVEAQWLERGGFFVRPDRARAASLRLRACEGHVGEQCPAVVEVAPPLAQPPVSELPSPVAETPPPPTRGEVSSVHVECRPNEVRFLGRSESVFDDLAATLAGHPEVTRLFLEGHASPDERDPEALARSRADSVVRELVRRHIDRARLVPSGSVEPAAQPLRGVTFRPGS